jgi:hypothetical protein
MPKNGSEMKPLTHEKIEGPSKSEVQTPDELRVNVVVEESVENLNASSPQLAVHQEANSGDNAELTKANTSKPSFSFPTPEAIGNPYDNNAAASAVNDLKERIAA